MADAKTIGASGVVATLAAVVVVALSGGKDPKELTLKAGATKVDKAVAAVASLSKTIRPVACNKHWGVVNGEQKLVWWCASDAGEVLADADAQKEMDKAAPEGIVYEQTPRQIGEDIVYDIAVKTGTEPPKPEYDREEKELLGIKE